MQCPHCSISLRVVEPIPAAFVAEHIRLVCPVTSCGGDIVALVQASAENQLAPIPLARMRGVAWARVARAQIADVRMAIVAAIGIMAATGLFVFLQWVRAPPAPNEHVVLVTCVAGFMTALVLVGGQALDVAIGAHAWLRELPRPLLNVMPVPETYR